MGGDLQPGQRLPTFAQMRQEHDATQATVDRVYNVLEKKGLIQRKANQGVFVAESREQADRVSTGVIGFEMTEEENSRDPYYLRLFSGVRQALARVGREVLVVNERSVIKWEKVDGVLICNGNSNNRCRLPVGMPCVSMLYLMNDLSCVIADDHAGATAAVEHLLQLGHRRIGMLVAGDSLASRRIAGYRSALRKAGIEPDPRWVRRLETPSSTSVPTFFQDAGFMSTNNWLADNWCELGCTALMAQNDEAAIGAIRALEAAGHKVPQDISVVGFDGTEISKYFSPRLTTVEVPLQEVGELAAELLLEQISQPLAEKEVAGGQIVKVLPMQLWVSESTGPVVNGLGG